MTEITKEVIVTKDTANTPVIQTVVKKSSSTTETVEYLIYFFLGLVEVLLGFRLILKLMGANTASSFVRLIYTLTGILIVPFDGIFRRGFAPGIETTSVLEPSTIVALIVYPVLIWGAITLLRVVTREEK